MMLIPFKLPALRKDEMRFKLDSKVTMCCCVAFQLPSTLGPRREQSLNTAPFSLSGRSTKRIVGDLAGLEVRCGAGGPCETPVAGMPTHPLRSCKSAYA